MTMKKMLSLCFVIAASAVSFNQNAGAALLDFMNGLLPQESFEEQTFPPEGWQKITKFDGSGWEQATLGDLLLGMEFFGPIIETPPGGGQNVAYASWATGDADSNYTTDQKTEQLLITPAISKIEDGDSLRFWARTFGKFDDNLDIMVSRTSADSVELFDTTIVSIAFADDGDENWKSYAYDLSAFIGDTIYVAFRENTLTSLVQGDALMLDLVQVSSLVTGISSTKINPVAFSLSQNYPNPFNPQTKIPFSLDREAKVSIHVFNVRGQAVAKLIDQKTFLPGAHEVQFNAGNLPTGVYYYKLTSGLGHTVKKMMLIK